MKVNVYHFFFASVDLPEIVTLFMYEYDVASHVLIGEECLICKTRSICFYFVFQRITTENPIALCPAIIFFSIRNASIINSRTSTASLLSMLSLF